MYSIIIVSTDLVGLLYKIRNYKKKKILIYTDSRGFEITKLCNRRNPFSSYIGYFIKKFNVDYYLCTEKHTTTLDFLNVYHRKKSKNYDYVILHTGVVDFSPRPKSMLNSIYEKKKMLIKKFISPKLFDEHKKENYKEQYMGELTNSIYSKKIAKENILPELREINNLIWISCNPVLKDWLGNYKKKRPDNMNIVLDFSLIFMEGISNAID